jgi:hypothetical protein
MKAAVALPNRHIHLCLCKLGYKVIALLSSDIYILSGEEIGRGRLCEDSDKIPEGRTSFTVYSTSLCWVYSTYVRNKEMCAKGSPCYPLRG